MKRILIFTLTLTLVLSIFIFPANAADNVNYNIEIDSTYNPPSIDGVIMKNEYGKPIHRFSENKSQFDYTKNNEFDDWDFTFYATWDYQTLYLAWEVETPRHAKLPLAEFNPDGTPKENTELTQESLGYLWMHSCVQLCITPCEPIDGKTDCAANNLNLGFGQLADDSTGKAIWCYPTGVTNDDIKGWEAVCTRDEVQQITTYEIAIPSKLTGVPLCFFEGVKFGLSYIVFAQEHVNVGKAGIQWQTGCFYQEDINKAGVVTLKGKSIKPLIPDLGPGRVPSHLRDKEKLCIPKFNFPIRGEDSTLITDIYGDMSNSDEGYNLLYTLSWALKPIGEDMYEITEISPLDGKVPEFKTLEDDSIIIAFHSDGEGFGKELLKQAEQYKVGTQIGLWGFDIEENRQKYSNSFAYIEKAVTDTETPPDDTSNNDTSNGNTSSDNTPNDDTSSTDTSNEGSAPVSSSPSDTISKNEPTDKSPVSENEASSNTESVAKESEEPSSPIVPIVLSVIGVAIVAAVVIIVIKKRK